MLLLVDAVQLIEWSKSLDACNREIAKQQEMNKALEATIVSMIGDNKFARYLMKVFKKKVKRRKKKEAEEEDG